MSSWISFWPRNFRNWGIMCKRDFCVDVVQNDPRGPIPVLNASHRHAAAASLKVQRLHTRLNQHEFSLYTPYILLRYFSACLLIAVVHVGFQTASLPSVAGPLCISRRGPAACLWWCAEEVLFLSLTEAEGGHGLKTQSGWRPSPLFLLPSTKEEENASNLSRFWAKK